MDTALRTEASADALAGAFAAEGGILGADVAHKVRFYNNVARGERFFGADALQGEGAWLTGAGEVVAVFDSGLSSGIPGYLGQEGAEAFHPGLRGRVMGISPQPWEAMSAPAITHRVGDGNDRSGHGTHVAGSVLGDGTGSENRRFRGVAPGARLFFQAHGTADGLLTGGAYVPPLLDPIFEEAYAVGAPVALTVATEGRSSPPPPPSARPRPSPPGRSSPPLPCPFAPGPTTPRND